MKLLSVFTSVVFCVLILAACSGGPGNASAEMTMGAFAGTYEPNEEMSIEATFEALTNLDSSIAKAFFPHWKPEEYEVLATATAVMASVAFPTVEFRPDSTLELYKKDELEASGVWTLKNDTITMKSKKAR